MKHVKLDIGEDGLVKAVGEPQHTPTPWEHLDLGIYGSENTEAIAIVKKLVDAEFIVKAVNNYQKMLDALKSVDLCDVKSIARVKIQDAILQAEA